MPLGNWNNATHQVWQWYYKKEDDNLQQIVGGRVAHYKPARGFRLTRSTTTYQQVREEQYNSQITLGRPTSVREISTTKVNKLQDGPDLVNDPKEHANFWDFICSWGGSWMWDDIDFTQDTTQDLKWVVEGMQNNALV